MKKLLFGVVMLLLVVSALWWWVDSRAVTNDALQPGPAEAAQPTLALTLPGGRAVEPRIEDYNDPASQWVIVSKQHPLNDPTYAPEHIARPDVLRNSDKTDEEQSVRRDIVPEVEMLFKSAKTAGYDLMLASGYRSYSLQKSYYDNYARVSGEAEANKYSAKPGQSEHQTGLAFDISPPDRTCYLETCFADTDAAKWLALHAHEHGFILRYPKGKTAITGYQYEPWHFRYVGKELATALYDTGLTLDEVYDALQATRSELIANGQIKE